MFNHEGDSLAEQLVIGLENLRRQFPRTENMCAEESAKVLSIHPVVSLVFGDVRQEAEKITK